MDDESVREEHAPLLIRAFMRDVGAAGLASFMVAPFVTVVDKSIISNASGRQPLRECVVESMTELVRKPHKFLRRREFVWIWSLYWMTYITANVTDSICEAKEQSAAMPKFLSTTVVNMSWCIAKDRAFTRMFGTKAPTAIPLATFGLFAGRDMMTIIASFSLPQPVAKRLPIQDPEKSLAAAQILLPLSVQVISTPLHLLGLDLYNRPESVRKERVAFISREYVKSAAMRMCRIGPAFGIGGVSNRYFRRKWNESSRPASVN